MTPAGSTCGMVYDWNGEEPAPTEGDGLRTPSGRRYLIVEARRVRSAKHASRWRYTLLVLGVDDEDPERYADLVWNPRDRRTA